MLKGKTITSIQEPTGLKPSKTINQYEIKTEQSQKIDLSKNLNFNIKYLQDNIPGHHSFYYHEVNTFLSTLEPINENNKFSILQRFQDLGSGPQQRVQNIADILAFMPKATFKYIKEQHQERYSKFSLFNKPDEIQDFLKFNAEIKNLSSLYIKYIDIENKKIQEKFKDLNRLYFYWDFFKFIAKELQERNILSQEELSNSTIATRITSLYSSIQVVQQFKQIYDINLESIEMEYNNICNYLNNLKPSLELLQHQNPEEFRKEFRNLIKN